MSGDINDAEKKKRRLAVLTVSFLMLMAMVAAVAVGVTTGKRKRAMHDHAPGGGDGGHGGDHSNVEASHKAVKSICHPTDYRRMCKRTLSNTNSTDPRELIQTAFHAAIENIEEVMKNSSSFKPPKNDTRTTWALETCKEVMEYALGDLHRANDQMGEFDPNKLDDYVENMRIWLSGAINFQETCIDAFENTTGNIGDQMKQSLNNSQELTSNGLAMATQLVDFLRSMNISGLGDIKRLLSEEHGNSGEHGSPRGHGNFGEHGNSKEHDTTEKHDNSEKHGRSEEHHNSGEHGKLGSDVVLVYPVTTFLAKILITRIREQNHIYFPDGVNFKKP